MTVSYIAESIKFLIVFSFFVGSLSPVSHSEIVKLKKELQNAMDNFKFKQTETETLREKFFTLSREVETLRRIEIECSTEIEALKVFSSFL